MSDICPICRGIGWRIVAQNGIEIAERCECVQKQKTQDLLKHAKIPKRYHDCALENFKLEQHGEESQKLAKQRIEHFVKAYPAVKSGLLLVGPPGTGKTHLSVAAMKAIIQKTGVECLFYDFYSLLKDIQSSYSKETSFSESDVLQPVLCKEVLLLDELGASKMSPWVQDTLTHILNYRYNEKLTTIITSNWMDKDWVDENKNLIEKETDNVWEETLDKRIGYRLRSRLYEMCDTIYISPRCSDYRQRIHAKHKSRLPRFR